MTKVYSDFLTQLLEKRGLKNQKEIDIFLNPDYVRDLHDPYLMKDMEISCVRLFEAIENKEKIVIYADYDCDGIPGAVVLQDLFKEIKYTNFEVYIPQRNSEGYGLNMTAIKQFAENGVKLLITIDLGITAVNEVAQARIEGIDVIITDHHLPSETLPKAYAILNPKIDEYPERMLCGAGVMFKFVQGFIKKYGEYFKIKQGWEKWSLDMAGLATLSDMVPLTGENRALAYFGLKVLRKSRRPGFGKLLAKMNMDQRYLVEDDVGFMIAPRLNAASRMDDPMRAFELLSTDDEAEGGTLASHLSKINDERKTIVATIIREVNKKFRTREIGDVIVIGNPEWKIGVLGLVAGKISDEYKKPVFVWGKDENECIKGSCRSDGSISVVEIMVENKDYFSEYGGHEQAGGFSVHPEKIHFLEQALNKSFSSLRKLKKEDEISFDMEIDLSTLSMKNWKELEKLSPFGFGNPKPVFLFRNVKIEKLKKFGKNGSGEHLEITFSDSSCPKAIAISFFSNEESFKIKIKENMVVDLVATFDLSRFRGKEELRLRIVDII